MGRKSDGIRAWYDEKAKKWHIRDPYPDAPRAKFSLGFGKDGPPDDPNYKDRAAEEVRLYKLRKQAGNNALLLNQPTDQVLIADIIALYIEKRITKWVKSKEYKTPISRPDEVKHRLKIVLSFFKGATLSAVTRTNCEAFGDYLHKREIARARALYDIQMKIYSEKLEVYQKKVDARKKFIADLKERGWNRVLPPLRSKPPTPLPPFNPDDIERRPSASRRYLEDLQAAIKCAVLYDVIKHRVTVHLPPKYDPRKASFSINDIKEMYRHAFFFKGMGWVDGKPVKGLFTRRHLARFMFVSGVTGSRKDRVERVGFVDDGESPWVELWQTTEARIHNVTGVEYTRTVWNGIYHRRGDDEIEYGTKLAPSVPLASGVAAIFAKWREAGIKYPCAYPYGRYGKEEPGDVGDGMRAIFDYFFGGENDAVVHTFRHTVATHLCAEGKLPFPAIAAYLGMSLETLIRIYAKFRDQDLEKVAAVIGSSSFHDFNSRVSGTKGVRTKNGRQKSTEIDRTKQNENSPNETKADKKRMNSRSGVI
ncbi:hypothetical protein [Peteryoungia algae]|uniref:Tyr recombinase domain-containing protein n=1 Tax=Peteryoungia algae TaxID=2919917 RepID=A0ABT0CXF4_9HYPH|nr:hypothetical protein [Rhizobium sp. SSM4.3]MCJ8237828.1 hypothetical protein [Rhizobium sp. SSM4.3]